MSRVKQSRPKMPLTPRELDATDAASEADREWFKAHADRTHRLRPARAYEMPGLTAKQAKGLWIVVRQIQPGFRVRMDFRPTAIPLDNEAIAHAIFDLLVEQGGQAIPIETVATRAIALATGGRA